MGVGGISRLWEAGGWGMVEVVMRCGPDKERHGRGDAMRFVGSIWRRGNVGGARDLQTMQNEECRMLKGEGGA